MANDDPLDDWRIKGKARIAAPVPPAYDGGPSFKEGDPVFLITRSGDGKSSFDFITPNLVALSLNLAVKNAKLATGLKARFGIENHDVLSGKRMRMHERSIPAFYDLIEAQIATITFAMQSIEAFVNEEINKERMQNKTKKFTFNGKELDWGAKRIQEEISTSKKLEEVLPTLRSVKGPSGELFWKNFQELRKLRDAVVHMISSRGFQVDPNTPELVFRLFIYDARKSLETAFNLIDFFCDGNSELCQKARTLL